MRILLVAAVLCVAARASAQTPSPDYEAAKQRYDAGSRAMDAGNGAQAATEFLAAFEITKDPVLFFKIGSAYEKAGSCADALVYYQRYLDEAKPAESFAALTRERIVACKAMVAPPTTPPTPPDTTTPAESPPAADAAPAAVVGEQKPAEPMTQPSRDKDRAWLFVGGALTFVTAGAVLAYSTASAEQDIKDLYISEDGEPPSFDASTRERYENLLDEGRRYEVLAWTSFGLAAGCAIGATIFFLRDDGNITVTPVVTPKETGVSATLRF